MVCLPSQEHAEAYMQELKQLDGTESWIIGEVVEDPNRKAKIVDNIQFLQV